MIRVFPDPAAALSALAERIVSEAGGAIALRGEFRIALSGGTTPVTLYRMLASAAWRERIEWSRCVLLFADERAVPVGDADRTDRLVREMLLEPLALDVTGLRSMRAESEDLDAAALEYEEQVRLPIDLLLLGAGPDGHIASLFPHAPALTESVRRVVAVTASPKPPPRRITLTPRAIGEARSVCVLALGEGKSNAVSRALDPATSAQECPAALVRDRDWYIDAAAAARRGEGHPHRA